MDVTGCRRLSLWKRGDLQHPQPDEVAEEIPVALDKLLDHRAVKH